MSEAPVSVPAEAMQALDRFLNASLRRDEEAMKSCVTRKTLELGKMHTQGPEGVRFIKGDARMEGDNAVMPIKAIRNDAPDDEEAVMEMDCVMAREDGEWKFDLLTTMDRLMGGSLDEVVNAMTSQMAEAMKGVGEALAGGMQEAFGQISSAISEGGQISSATSEGGQKWISRLRGFSSLTACAIGPNIAAIMRMLLERSYEQYRSIRSKASKARMERVGAKMVFCHC
ncbi:MAG: hypothetical protein NTX50_31740 [Candidatus Sumerlaeota bacterium]|nr:hypothetical protein [Candidatus Sumerlaeota bacterium]